jgi:hypothetical protein
VPLLWKRRSGPELYQATRSSLPEVFQQTLWIGGTCEEAKKQEVVPRGAIRDRALRRSVPSSFALLSRPGVSPVCHRKFPPSVRNNCNPYPSPRVQRFSADFREFCPVLGTVREKRTLLGFETASGRVTRPMSDVGPNLARSRLVRPWRTGGGLMHHMCDLSRQG